MSQGGVLVRQPAKQRPAQSQMHVHSSPPMRTFVPLVPALPVPLLHVPQPDGSTLVYALVGYANGPVTASRGMDWRLHGMAAAAPVAPAAPTAAAAVVADAEAEVSRKERDSLFETPPEGLFVPVQLDADDTAPTPVASTEAPLAVAPAGAATTEALPPLEPDCDDDDTSSLSSPPSDSDAPHSPPAGGDAGGLCKFYLEGSCKKRAECAFRHPARVRQQPTLAPRMVGAVCKYYLTPAGCRAAAQCRLVHVVEDAAGVAADGCCADRPARRSHRGKRG